MSLLPLLPKSFPAGYISGTEHFYTLAQIKAYGQKVRAAALEEYAQVCDERANGENDAQYCADRIGSMKS
jgi:hypothetical protein